MPYDLKESKQVRQSIIALMENAKATGIPRPSSSILAREVGRTRQRVLQILHEEGYDVSSWPTPIRKRSRRMYVCLECGEKKKHKVKRCRACRSKLLKLICAYCNNEFERTQRKHKHIHLMRVKNNLVVDRGPFCSRSCSYQESWERRKREQNAD